MRTPRLLATALLLLAALAVAACSGGGPKRRINPPRASLQELAVQQDGSWRASVRLQNFSTVSMKFVDVAATLEVGGQQAIPLNLQPAITVGPESAEVVVVTIAPGAAAKTAVASGLAAGRSVRYRVAGDIRTDEPKGSFEFEYESALSPVPGLPGVLR